ncbi:hypothetical protein [Nonomuraea sp. NPDC050786]|uniref:hypothetical protein n=1 Tax=Nonomuraea sp. NPDC050786 TaxID=3154840 RepID=UPI0033D054BB
MAISKETVEALQNAAEGGDVDAALEVGRLLCMLRVGPDDDPDEPEVIQSWPEEPWLRAAVEACPDDTRVATLLASRLVQQIAVFENDVDLAAHYGEDEITLARRRDEARNLYGRVLRSAPGDPAASAGMAMLDASSGEVGDSGQFPGPFSYYELSLDHWSGSFCHSEVVIVTGLDELRWAYEQMMRPHIPTPAAYPTLQVYFGGEEGEFVKLEGVLDLGTVTIPPLTGTPLPLGHPVQGGLAHYGYSCNWG